MPVACTLGFILLRLFVDESVTLTIDFTQFSILTSGIIIGLAYVLAELPNSFVKRRLGAAPGELPEKNARIFMLADQLDSGILCLIAYWYFWGMPLVTCLATLVMAPVIALVVKRILFLLGLKRSAT